MKTIRPNTRNSRPWTLDSGPSPRQGGAVLIVVISLMAALAFLGFLFYSMSTQSETSAQAFNNQPDGILDGDADLPLDFALNQIIVSTPANLVHSALYGGQDSSSGTPVPAPSRHSMLAHVIGPVNPDGSPTDVTPYSGRGIEVIVADGDGDMIADPRNPRDVLFDYNGDGQPDADATTAPPGGTNGFVLNFSAAANNGTPFDLGTPGNGVFAFQPDAGYTYPDVNSLFLAYDTVIQTPGGPARIVIPSFFRPQLFPRERMNGFDSPSIFGRTRNRQVLRPSQGERNTSGRFRYVITLAGVPAASGDTSRVIGRFPFDVDLDSDGNQNEFGVFSLVDTNGDGIPDGPADIYEYDVDADGDGTTDSLLMDLEHPIIDLPDGRQAVPLFFAKIVDADALLNTNFVGQLPLFTGASNTASANAASQIYGAPQPLANLPYWLHASNLGLSPSEINPLYALDADPNNTNDIRAGDVAAATVPHRGYYADHSTNPPTDTTAGIGFNRRQMAHTELTMMLEGRPEYEPDLSYSNTNPSAAIPGRYGEQHLLRPALGDLAAGPQTGIFPQAGVTAGADDNGDNVPDRPWNPFTDAPAAAIPYDDDADDNIDPHVAPTGAGVDGPLIPADNIGSGIAQLDNRLGRPTPPTPALTPPITYPPFVHPLDYSGLGNYGPLAIFQRYLLFDPDPAAPGPGPGGPLSGTRVLSSAGVDAMHPNPSTWPAYGNRWRSEDVNGNGVLDPGEDVNGNLAIDFIRAYQPAVWQNQERPTLLPINTNYVVPWTRAGNPGVGEALQQYTGFDGLTNEPDEIRNDSSFPTSDDAPFPPSEMAFLHLSERDWQSIREDTRLRELLNFNFRDNRRAAQIRARFTTDSRDRLEHDYAPFFTEDVNFNGVLDPPNEDVNGNGMLDAHPRAWEANDLNAITLNRRFPPRFGATGGPFGNGHTSRHEGPNPPLNRTPPPPAGPPINTTPLIDPLDPFRPVTRRLLTVEAGVRGNIGSDRALPGQRLDLNRLLVNFDANGNPLYRRLTPHPVFNGGEMDTNGYLTSGGNVRPVVHNHPTYAASYYPVPSDPLGIGPRAHAYLDPSIPAFTDPISGASWRMVPYAAINTNKFAREAWARYDRQRLARDIYVLLYTLGGPDNINPTTAQYPDNDGDGVPDLPQLMAQFAVNYVDALDQDDVITRFEYDANLTNGWNIDPTIAGGDTTRVAFGVETQQLTFSEVLLIQAASQSTDYQETLHNENGNEHQFLYIELRNASAFPVELRTGSYRIVRDNDQDPNTPATDAEVEFTSNTNITDARQVGPGENFLCACHDGFVTNSSGVTVPSDFYVNLENSTELEAVIPRSNTIVPSNGSDPVNDATDVGGNPRPAPFADLDFAVTDAMTPGHEKYYNVTKPYATGGGMSNTLVQSITSGAASPENFDLVLQRRPNIFGANLAETDWVEVDRISVTGRSFAPTNDGQADIQMELQQNVMSTERRQTFDAATSDFNPAAGFPVPSTYRLNSMFSAPANKHRANSYWFVGNSGSFDLWQPHFNRDYSSVYELLSLPVVGPDRLVSRLRDRAYGTPNNRMSGWSNSNTMNPIPFAASAIIRHPDGMTPPPMVSDDNRWYRLFEFLDRAPRTNDVIQDSVTLARRTDARINLNTLRQESVLAGLIDDDIQLANALTAPRPTIDRRDGTNWFDQLLLARDGLDPFTGIPLPGVPGGFPFRGLSYLNPQVGPANPNLNPVSNSVLRGHRPAPDFPLFDARPRADADGNPANGEDIFDFHTRERLLRKIANNTTNRSHVFMIWLGYELFEAHQPDPVNNPGEVQIGARIEDSSPRREFLVVDMTRLEEAYNPVSNRFDFRKFIIYRKRIQ